MSISPSKTHTIPKRECCHCFLKLVDVNRLVIKTLVSISTLCSLPLFFTVTVLSREPPFTPMDATSCNKMKEKPVENCLGFNQYMLLNVIMQLTIINNSFLQLCPISMPLPTVSQHICNFVIMQYLIWVFVSKRRKLTRNTWTLSTPWGLRVKLTVICWMAISLVVSMDPWDVKAKLVVELTVAVLGEPISVGWWFILVRLMVLWLLHGREGRSLSQSEHRRHMTMAKNQRGVCVRESERQCMCVRESMCVCVKAQY
jgi:hypothetical protein